MCEVGKVLWRPRCCRRRGPYKSRRMATGHAQTPGRDSLPGGRHEVDVGGVVVDLWWSAVAVEAVAVSVEEGIRGFGGGISGAAA